MGIHLLLICFLRPTTALLTDEQSDTHVTIDDTPESVREGMVSPQAHNGIHIQHSRGINFALSLVSFLLW